MEFICINEYLMIKLYYYYLVQALLFCKFFSEIKFEI